MRFLPVGDAALLVELGDLAHTLALYRQLKSAELEGVEELVPAARTVLVRYAPALISTTELIAAVQQWAAVPHDKGVMRETRRLVEIPVHYDGEDLSELAELLGLSVAEVITRHTGQVYEAAFAGFAPGFVYLAGNPFGREIPRRSVPRTQVPAGAVALAGDFAAVYPTASPGGWQLLGRTDVIMWDLTRQPTAWVQPGLRVRFVEAGRATTSVSVAVPKKTVTAATASPDVRPALEFLKVGLQTLMQDGGRLRQAALGISRSGALDRGAMRRANRLVGNPPQASVLENVLGQLTFRAHRRVTVAVTGAAVPIRLKSSSGQEWALAGESPLALDDGDQLALGAVTAGMRVYVAVRGGLQVAPVLGGCATDTLAAVGPPPLRVGDRMAVGQALPATDLRAVAPAELAAPPLPRAGDVVTLDITLGPRNDWLTAAALELLVQQAWRVTPRSNRIGLRLHGEQPLARSRHDELPSEGVVPGAIQVPSSGQPVLFLADHPLTGGYPVVAVVAHHHLDLAGQIPVGCTVRFRPMIHPGFSSSPLVCGSKIL